METNQTTKPHTDATPTQPEPNLHRTHTYQDDLAQAMNATDAVVVQEMLETAREKEREAKEEVSRERERVWYRSASTFLVFFSIIAIAYGYYHYRTLSVPVQKTPSVGVFPNTTAHVAGDTTIDNLVHLFMSDGTLVENKPVLVQIVSDTATLAPLSVTRFFKFIEANVTEPFAGAINSIRLGMMNTGEKIVPFIILSVVNHDIASKEFLIAEPKLLEYFSKALSIDTSQVQQEIGGGFESDYVYNLPVRRRMQQDPATKEKSLVLVYGYATDTIMVVTADPSVLKVVYDTIIRQ